MGNRCCITTDKDLNPKSVGIYLHWNGGRDSVEAFLWYCKLNDYCSPEIDGYGWASLVRIIANYIDSRGLSIGINTLDHLDIESDNGTYIIKNWEIIDHLNVWEMRQNNGKVIRFNPCDEQREYDLYEMVKVIHDAQPKSVQDNAIKVIKARLEGWEKALRTDKFSPLESPENGVKEQWEKFLEVLTKTYEESKAFK